MPNPTLKIVAHSYRKVETTDLSFDGNSMVPSAHTATTTETVTASFEVENLEDFRYGRSETFRRLYLLKVIFESTGQSGWTVERYTTTASANNVLKSGELGAMVQVTWFDLPWAVQELVRTEALDWVRSEYTR
jgi:hypothetical protein